MLKNGKKASEILAYNSHGNAYYNLKHSECPRGDRVLHSLGKDETDAVLYAITGVEYTKRLHLTGK